MRRELHDDDDPLDDLDDLGGEDGVNDEEEGDKPADADKPAPTQEEIIAAAVAKGIEEHEARKAASAAKTDDKGEKPFHPGLTPTEIHDSAVDSSVHAIQQFNDSVDEGMEEIEEAVGANLTRQELKQIRKEMRSLTPAQLKQCLATKSHLNRAYGIVGAKSVSANQAKRRAGVGSTPVGARGGSAKGGGRDSSLAEFEGMYGKVTDKRTRQELRDGGHTR